MKEKNLLAQENVNETGMTYEAPFIQVEEVMVERGFSDSNDPANGPEEEIDL